MSYQTDGSYGHKEPYIEGVDDYVSRAFNFITEAIARSGYEGAIGVSYTVVCPSSISVTEEAYTSPMVLIEASQEYGLIAVDDDEGAMKKELSSDICELMDILSNMMSSGELRYNQWVHHKKASNIYVNISGAPASEESKVVMYLWAPGENVCDLQQSIFDCVPDVWSTYLPCDWRVRH